MPTVLLASASERRRMMMKDLFSKGSVELEFCKLKGAEPKPSSGLEVNRQVEDSCLNKAMFAVMERGKMIQADIIVVSDTLVEDPDDYQVALGKPKDDLEATATLIRLSGRRHKVWSSTAIISRSPEGIGVGLGWSAKIFTDYSIVEFDEIDSEMLEHLIGNGSWIGKAGGYDLAGDLGEFSKVILGDESTVLGLSISAIGELRRVLN